MDIGFWILAFFPVVFATIMKILFWDRITWIEFVIQTVLCTILVVGFWLAGMYSGARDLEIWNGTVSNKQMVQRDCKTGWNDSKDSFCEEYDTRSVYDYTSCSKDSNGNESCTDHYKTQYRYEYEWERKWYVTSANLDRVWEIERVDLQGANMPDRYAEVQVGDPVSITNPYDNWVRAASSSLFHEDGLVEEQYAALIPEYPISLYDYYKVDRVLQIGVEVPDISEWNADLSRILGTLGPERQMNAVIVFVDANQAADDYAYAVRRAWQGFKKNDAVIFIGLDAELRIRWTNVLSWSKENVFNVALRNEILTNRYEIIDRETVINAISDIGMRFYVRRSMDEFEYLKAEIPTPLWLIVLTIFFGVGGSIGLSYFFWTHNIDEMFNHTRRRFR